MNYKAKGGRLWGERGTFVGRKGDVCGAKGGRLWGDRILSGKSIKIPYFIRHKWIFQNLKGDVYGAKGGRL